MVSKNIISGLAWFLVISGLGLAGFGLYSLGFNNNPLYSIPLLVVGLVLFFIGIAFYVMSEKKAKQLKEQERSSRGIRRSQIISSEILVSPDERELVTNTQFQFTEESPESKTLAESGLLKAKRIYSLRSEEVCMISKIPLTRNNQILQCPSCQSFFIEEYLIKWLQEKPYCPVCKAPLKY
ncbi:MAG: hypothetical protein JXA54_10945 [Candidatus Heimdallarchaeota archaeon]|nr:hypothetical protein [Candidatus Heimdallarchaeota archaeon]